MGIGQRINFNTCSFPIYGRYPSGMIIKFIKKPGGMSAKGLVISRPASRARFKVGHIYYNWVVEMVTEIEPTQEMLNIECPANCNKNCNNCDR